MNGLEWAAVITAVGGFIGVVGALLVNARKIAELQLRLDDQHERAEDTRRDIILLGERYRCVMADNEILAELFNDMWSDIYRITGKRPEVDLARLKRLTTLRQTETGRLGPI